MAALPDVQRQCAERRLDAGMPASEKRADGEEVAPLNQFCRCLLAARGALMGLGPEGQ